MLATHPLDWLLTPQQFKRSLFSFCPTGIHKLLPCMQLTSTPENQEELMFLTAMTTGLELAPKWQTQIMTCRQSLNWSLPSLTDLFHSTSFSPAPMGQVGLSQAAKSKILMTVSRKLVDKQKACWWTHNHSLYLSWINSCLNQISCKIYDIFVTCNCTHLMIRQNIENFLMKKKELHIFLWV